MITSSIRIALVSAIAVVSPLVGGMQPLSAETVFVQQAALPESLMPETATVNTAAAPPAEARPEATGNASDPARRTNNPARALLEALLAISSSRGGRPFPMIPQ